MTVTVVVCIAVVWIVLIRSWVGLAISFVEQVSFNTGRAPHSFVYEYIPTRHAIVEMKVAMTLCTYGIYSVGRESQR